MVVVAVIVVLVVVIAVVVCCFCRFLLGVFLFAVCIFVGLGFVMIAGSYLRYLESDVSSRCIFTPYRQDSTYPGLCYTSRGALAGMKIILKYAYGRSLVPDL